jgi:hypothetical protein
LGLVDSSVGGRTRNPNGINWVVYVVDEVLRSGNAIDNGSVTAQSGSLGLVESGHGGRVGLGVARCAIQVLEFSGEVEELTNGSSSHRIIEPELLGDRVVIYDSSHDTQYKGVIVGAERSLEASLGGHEGYKSNQDGQIPLHDF